jgi:hypothetical protein
MITRTRQEVILFLQVAQHLILLYRQICAAPLINTTLMSSAFSSKFCFSRTGNILEQYFPAEKYAGYIDLDQRKLESFLPNK